MSGTTATSSSAVVVGFIDMKARKAVKKPRQPHPSGLPTCEFGTKTFEDITHSDRRNNRYTCGSCGELFRVGPKDVSIQLPVHRISPELHELRKRDERAAKRQNRAN